jgi:RNA polymerase sigma-70 factor (ECF subfamily)
MSASDPSRLHYERLVHAHAADLYRFAYRLTGRAELGQDLVQETFLEAWRSIAQQKNPETARAWLFSILRHRWAHLCRDAARRIQALPSSHAFADFPAGDATAADALADEEVLRNALDTVDPRFKEALLMVFMQGLSCKQAASELGVPIGTVLSRISRARAALRTALSKSGETRSFRSATEAPDV